MAAKAALEADGRPQAEVCGDVQAHKGIAFPLECQLQRHRAETHQVGASPALMVLQGKRRTLPKQEESSESTVGSTCACQPLTHPTTGYIHQAYAYFALYELGPCGGTLYAHR